MAIVLMVLAGGLAALGTCNAAEAEKKIPAEDEKAIRQIVDTLESAWNALDAKTTASVFSDDAEFINVVGMQWRGKAAIEKAHAVYFELLFKNCKLHTDEVTIRPLGPEHAIATWVCTQDTFTTPSGSVVPKHQNRLTLVVVKGAKDGWKIVQGQNTRIDAEAARFDPVK